MSQAIAVKLSKPKPLKSPRLARYQSGAFLFVLFPLGDFNKKSPLKKICVVHVLRRGYKKCSIQGDTDMTEAQKTRLQRDWDKMAGEQVSIEQIGGAIYAFCSELGALRMFHRYNSDKARAAFSKPRNSWFFSLETSL